MSDGQVRSASGIPLPPDLIAYARQMLPPALPEQRDTPNIDTPFLAGHGGHIGYDVAPGHRRKGYGHLALRIALKEASALGLSRLLLFAAEDNLASRAVIERQGGELDSISFSEFYNERLCRYWINRSLS
jgi:RimJ/RimL family protein N-acetyltransferase